MPPIIPETIAEVRVVGELHGSECVNVWHVASTEVFVDFETWESALLLLAAAMLECCQQFLLPAVTSDYRLVRTEAKRIYPTATDPFIQTALAGDVGQLGPTSVSFASSLVNIRTGQGGKRGRGRKYLPPPGEANIEASNLDNDTLIAIAAFLTCVATKFVGATPAANWHLGVLSRKDAAGILGNLPGAFRQAQSLNPVVSVACMRSRKKGHGS